MKFLLLTFLFPSFVRHLLFRLWDFGMSALLLFVVVPCLWLLIKLGIKKRHIAPKVVFGAAPLINSKYHSKALNLAGVDSITVVRHIQTWITTEGDFDTILNPPPGGGSIWRRWYIRLFHKHITFARLLWSRDVFFYYFDGFYLSWSGPLRWLEVPALKLLGKRIVVMPYGGDVTIPADCPDLHFRYALIKDYPQMGKAKYAKQIRHQVRHFTRWADVVIAGTGLSLDHLLRIDYLTPSCLAIDESEWQPNYGPPRAIGDLFKVIHSPNHRYIKGTQFVINAVKQLKDEGLNVELVLLERVSNSEIRRKMADCHVVAEQLVPYWPSLNALEGMALGKPVLCNVRPDLDKIASVYSFFGECPIVRTPSERVTETLRHLYHHPEQCQELGRKGRAYIERYHSLDAMGGFLKGVVELLWSDVPFNQEEHWLARGKHVVSIVGNQGVRV